MLSQCHIAYDALRLFGLQDQEAEVKSRYTEAEDDAQFLYSFREGSKERVARRPVGLG
jgi:hypothetical protein